MSKQWLAAAALVSAFFASCSQLDYTALSASNLRNNPNDPGAVARSSSGASVAASSTPAAASSTPAAASSSAASSVISYNSPVIEIYTKLLNRNNANQLNYAPGMTNVVSIIGELGELIVLNGPHSNMLLSNWTPNTVASEMEPLPGNIWRIVLSNCHPTNAQIRFFFINGTPGSPLVWANKEMAIDTNTGLYTDIQGRNITLTNGVHNTYWLTNDGVLTNQLDMNQPRGISIWKNIGATYAVSANLTFVFTNVTDTVYRSSGMILSPGTNIGLFGSMNGWGGEFATLTAPLIFPQTLVFPQTAYSGPATIEFQMRSFDNAGDIIYGGTNTNNSADWITTLKQSDTGKNVFITNPGPVYWRGNLP